MDGKDSVAIDYELCLRIMTGRVMVTAEVMKGLGWKNTYRVVRDVSNRAKGKGRVPDEYGVNLVKALRADAPEELFNSGQKTWSTRLYEEGLASINQLIDVAQELLDASNDDRWNPQPFFNSCTESGSIENKLELEKLSKNGEKAIRYGKMEPAESLLPLREQYDQVFEQMYRQTAASLRRTLKTFPGISGNKAYSMAERMLCYSKCYRTGRGPKSDARLLRNSFSHANFEEDYEKGVVRIKTPEMPNLELSPMELSSRILSVMAKCTYSEFIVTLVSLDVLRRAERFRGNPLYPSAIIRRQWQTSWTPASRRPRPPRRAGFSRGSST